MTSIYENPAILKLAQQWGTIFHQSGFFQCGSPAQGSVIALEMIASGSTPTAMMERYHVMGNKLTQSASSMLADFNRAGGIHRIKSYNSELCSIEFQMGETVLLVSISWEEAQQENWPFKKDGKTLVGNWKTPLGRAAMLFARVTTRGIRAVAPEVAGSVYAPEEMGDDGSAPTAVDPEAILTDPQYAAVTVSLLPDHLTKASDNSYCVQAQIDRIETLLQQIEQWDPEIRENVASRVGELRGINELTMREADQLIEALTMKQDQHVF